MPKLIRTEWVNEWALCYLEYGSDGADGLDDEEIAEIDNWVEDNFPRGYVMDVQWDEVNELDPTPLFGGLADKTIKVNFYEP